MKVKELIRVLLGKDPEAPVVTYSRDKCYPGSGLYSVVSGVGSYVDLTKAFQNECVTIQKECVVLYYGESSGEN